MKAFEKNNALNISDVISLLRFPLAVFVVFIHVEGAYFHFENLSTPTYLITHFFSNIVCKVAVPTFYFISGYLFFLNIKDLNKIVYRSKLTSRVKSLLVPYLAWNTIAFLLFLFVTSLGIGCFRTHFTISDNFIMNIIHIYGYIYSWGWQNALGWSVNHFVPIDGPLWFIRDLMIVVLFTPIINKMIRKFDYYVLIVLFLILVLLQYPTFIAIFYFSLGSYFSIKIMDPLEFYYRNKYLLWIIMLILIIPSFRYGSFYKQVMLLPYVIITIGCARYIGCSLAFKLKALSRYSFSVYCTHLIISMPIIVKCLEQICPPQVVYYFICGIGSVCLSMILYHILRPINKWFKIV